jgi:S1-C subfamily serine protease
MHLPSLLERSSVLCGLNAVVVAIALCLAPPGEALAQGKAVHPRPITPRGALTADETTTIELFKRTRPSVVYITTVERVVDLFGFNARDVPSGTGSGFLWDEQGHVVTNYHVIAGARGAQVKLSDQRSFAAQLVGASPEHDIAVLRIEVKERLPAPLGIGTSRDLQVGQRVFAIGNPFGLDHTLTSGIISALDRSIAGEGRAIFGLVQIDAAINPGNSGGPLLDSAGRLIGMNTAIYSPSGASAGIGFAVPIDTINRVVPELIAYGRYEVPSLGIGVLDRVSTVYTERTGVAGALILRVEPNSPAAQAGLVASQIKRDGTLIPGDVLQRIDDAPVDSSESIDRALDGRRVGDKVTLSLLRDGKTVNVTLTLTPRPTPTRPRRA